MSELLDAVDELTIAKRVKVMQDEDVATVEVPALLTQLDEAIRSSLGGSAAGASLKSMTSIANPVALFKMMQISSQVRDWCRLVGVAPMRDDTARSLRVWYAAWVAVEADEGFYVKSLRSWANSIRSLLDPPRERELPDACPACGAEEWWRDGERFLHPLVVQYRLDDPVDSARGVCRACEQEWGARELAFILEQIHRQAV